MGIAVDIETFACMAEARAHYYKQGYVTLNNTADGSRYCLVKDIPGQISSAMVVLTKVDFLKVQAEHI